MSSENSPSRTAKHDMLLMSKATKNELEHLRVKFSDKNKHLMPLI